MFIAQEPSPAETSLIGQLATHLCWHWPPNPVVSVRFPPQLRNSCWEPFETTIFYRNVFKPFKMSFWYYNMYEKNNLCWYRGGRHVKRHVQKWNIYLKISCMKRFCCIWQEWGYFGKIISSNKYLLCILFEQFTDNIHSNPRNKNDSTIILTISLLLYLKNVWTNFTL